MRLRCCCRSTTVVEVSETCKRRSYLAHIIMAVPVTSASCKRIIHLPVLNAVLCHSMWPPKFCLMRPFVRKKCRKQNTHGRTNTKWKEILMCLVIINLWPLLWKWTFEAVNSVSYLSVSSFIKVCSLTLTAADRSLMWRVNPPINKSRICAAEMAVRYAALCACRKVHTWRWPISENRSFSILDVRS